MSMSARILIRETTPSLISLRISVKGCRTPSTLRRTTILSACGSKWMSEALCRIPAVRISSTSETTVPYSATSRSLGPSLLLLGPCRGLQLALARVHEVESLVQDGGSRHDGHDVQTGHQLDIVDGEHVRRVDHREHERALAVQLQGQHLARAAEPLSKKPHGARVRHQFGQGRQPVVPLPGKGGGDLIRGDEPQLDKSLAQSRPGGPLVLEACCSVESR